MTRSFYLVQNSNFNENDLIQKLERLSKITKSKSILGYKEDSCWLPLFNEQLCEGYIAKQYNMEEFIII